MSDTHHLIVSYAGSREAACLQALQDLALPHLGALLKLLTISHTDNGDERDFAPPHERALARALGLPTDATPWAALHQAQQGHHPGNTACAFVTPSHWRIGADRVHMGDPSATQLDDAASQALLSIVAPWFAEDGIALHYDRADRWLAEGEIFKDLRTASIDRVAQRDVRPWLPDISQAKVLHRLQSEMQMLLYTHAFNDGREAARLPAINAFWFHGAGALPAGYSVPANPPAVDDRLRSPTLASNWPAWAKAWQALDAEALAPLQQAAAARQAVALTLCGEHNAVTYRNTAQPLWQKIKQQFTAVRPADVLKQL